MNVLLLSMPDSFEHMAPVAVRMPNGALTSLAGNIDPHHTSPSRTSILVQDRVVETVERLVRERRPDVVGLSVMTFQRRTALRLIACIRALLPQAASSSAATTQAWRRDAYARPARGRLHRPRRRRDDVSRAAAGARDGRRTLDIYSGPVLARTDGGSPQPRSARQPARARRARAAERAARACSRGYTLLGRQVDVIETSRGCTFDCSFCSIIEMRGRNFHTFDFDRVLADIGDARRTARGRSFSSTTTSRSTSRASRRSARRSSTPG